MFLAQSYRLFWKAPVLFCHLCIMTPRDIGAMLRLSPHENSQPAPLLHNTAVIQLSISCTVTFTTD